MTDLRGRPRRHAPGATWNREGPGKPAPPVQDSFLYLGESSASSGTLFPFIFCIDTPELTHNVIEFVTTQPLRQILSQGENPVCGGLLSRQNMGQHVGP